MSYLVSAYEVDRAYGGPEEGGWWYDTGQLVRTIRAYPSANKAYDAARRANTLMGRLQRGVRDVGSVLYSGGRVWFVVHQHKAPDHFPTEIPHYE